MILTQKRKFLTIQILLGAVGLNFMLKPEENFLRCFKWNSQNLLKNAVLKTSFSLETSRRHGLRNCLPKRTDYASIIKAVQYFEKNKLGKKFNGGVQVGISDLPEFIKHFYCITRSDSTFDVFYFSDPAQNILGFIHYSGDVLFQILIEEFESKFVKAIKKTAFKRNNS